MADIKRHIKSKPYAYFMLAVLTVAYLLNFIDRQIISILAQDIKEGLGVDDASLGFLYGTAFAVFYAIFGIPLARLADVWNRKIIIGLGLVVWSLMTFLSGFAMSFAILAVLRIGVGIGEASFVPASVSMIADSFDKKNRATAMGFWSSAVYLGAGAGIAIGGWALGLYHRLYPNGIAPFGIDDWNLAMLIVGFPGLVLSLVVFSLREPKRGAMEDTTIQQGDKKHIFSFLMKEIGGTLPPFTLLSLYKISDDGKLFYKNIFYGVAIFFTAWLLSTYSGNPAQWYALAIGFYAFTSWIQRLKIIDFPCYSMIFQTKSLIFAILGFSVINFNAVAISFWAAPYVIRKFSLPASEISGMIGLIASVGGLAGMIIGGLLSDFWKKRHQKARIFIMMGAVALSTPLYLIGFLMTDLNLFFVMLFIAILISTTTFASFYALVSELTTSRVLATAISCYILLNSLIAFGMGPFSYGKLSVYLGSLGYSEADSLQMALVLGTIIIPILSFIFLYKSSRHVVEEENSMGQRDGATK